MPRRRSFQNLQKTVSKYLSNIYAGEIVLPRPHAVVCYSNDTIDEVLDKFKKHMYSRLPLVDRDTDKIVGYIFYKDFFSKYIETNGKFDLNEVRRNIIFVPENMNANDVLSLMNQNFTNIAVVVDEYGNHIGIITLEDIVEKVMGEMLDETDNKEDEDFEVQKLSQDEYLVSAWAPIEQVSVEIGLDIDDELLDKLDVRTLMGFMMFITGNIPKYNNVCEYKDFIFKVVEIENNRPSKILVKRK